MLRPAIVIGRDGSPCHWGVGKWNGLGVVELWGRGENPLPLVLVRGRGAAPSWRPWTSRESTAAPII